MKQGRNPSSGPQAAVNSLLVQRCPRCEAAIGWRCVRRLSNGEWIPMKTIHREREEANRDGRKKT